MNSMIEMMLKMLMMPVTVTVNKNIVLDCLDNFDVLLDQNIEQMFLKALMKHFVHYLSH